MLEQADGGEYRAIARGLGLPVRLKIWSGLRDREESRATLRGAQRDEVDRLYHEEASCLHRRMRRRLDHDAALDVVQTAFLRVLSLGSDHFHSIHTPQAYLIRVADSVANADLRGTGRRTEVRHDTCDESEQASSDPHEALEARDMLRRVEAAIALLPDRTREIFMAHRFEDLTYAQIAKRCGVSVKTVEWAISSALRKLHDAVGPLE